MRKIWLLLIVMAFCSACTHTNTITIKDDVISDDVHEMALKRIALNYNIIYGFQSYSDNTAIPYDKALRYFNYAGVYDQEEKIRDELMVYYDETQNLMTILAKTVDNYIKQKLNTIVDHTGIHAYDAKTDTYQIQPFQGDYYYSIQIMSSRKYSNKFEFICKSTDTISDNSAVLQRFIIEIKNQSYRFLSVSQLENADFGQ